MMDKHVDIWCVEYDVDYIPRNCDDYVYCLSEEQAKAFSTYKQLGGYVTRITKQTLDLSNEEDLEFYREIFSFYEDEEL